MIQDIIEAYRDVKINNWHVDRDEHGSCIKITEKNMS